MTGTAHKRPRKNPALAKAVKAAGGQTALAKAIDRKQASVWDWLNRGVEVPAGDAVKIERATGVPAEAINGVLGEFARMRGLEVRRGC